MSEQEYSDLTASNRRPSTPYSRNTPQSFYRGTQSYAFRRRQRRINIFGIFPIFNKNVLESENLVCCATAGTKTALGILQLRFNYLATSFLKALGKLAYTFSESQMPWCLFACPPLSLLVYGDDHPSLPI